MEKLIKSALGQWSIVSDTLNTLPQKDMTTLSKTSDIAPMDPTHNEKITDMFKAHSEAIKHGDMDKARDVKGAIKHYALTSPKGSLDIGHLSEQREGQADVDDVTTRDWSARVTQEDMIDIINHHVGDKERSLKNIHSKFGDDGVKALMHSIGADGGGPRHPDYTNLKLHPVLHHNISSLMNPGITDEWRKEDKHKGVLPFPPWHKTQEDVLKDPDHTKKVDSTYDGLFGTGDDDQFQTIPMKAHNNAVVDRGLDIFKNHYKNSEKGK